MASVQPESRRTPGRALIGALLFLAATGALLALLGWGGEAICGATVAGGGRGGRATACPLVHCPSCPQRQAGTATSGTSQQQDKGAHQRRQTELVSEAAAGGEASVDAGTSSSGASSIDSGSSSSGSSSSDSSSPTGSSTGQLAAAAEPADADLLCSGPAGIPSVFVSLGNSTRQLQAAPEEDFEPYKHGYTLADVEATAQFLKVYGDAQDICHWVQVRNGTPFFQGRPGEECGPDCNGSVLLIADGLQRGMAAGRLTIPEGLPLLFCVSDHTHCGPKEDLQNPCPAPVFAIFKNHAEREILVPHFKPMFEPHSVPWEEKRDLAFFRGAPICSGTFIGGLNATRAAKGCVRWMLAELSWQHPTVLNFTIVEDVSEHGGPRHVEGPPVGRDFYAQHKYLIAADGSTAAWRLGQLLSINSLALKQASRMVEWYYRAISPCVHFMHFWMRDEEDILELIAQLRGHPGNQLTAQRIAANAQAFAFTHLTDEGIWDYWQALINKHAALYRGEGPRDGGTGGEQVAQPSAAMAATAEQPKQGGVAAPQ